MFDLHIHRNRDGDLCVSLTSPGGQRSGRFKLSKPAEVAVYVIVSSCLGFDVAEEWLRHG